MGSWSSCPSRLAPSCSATTTPTTGPRCHRVGVTALQDEPRLSDLINAKCRSWPQISAEEVPGHDYQGSQPSPSSCASQGIGLGLDGLLPVTSGVARQRRLSFTRRSLTTLGKGTQARLNVMRAITALTPAPPFSVLHLYYVQSCGAPWWIIAPRHHRRSPPSQVRLEVLQNTP
ncbi:hypothetical protein GWK47_016147 [Chionoecetes opilio]|uniref:Uncharacterized protein n=1 Tax=Chionoecetes opilio TaxID=41210 RepID=A0A8J4XUT1_CHIOP|nr:hypothetical protein GWK47_016147 [Chionoecetes opilio]